MSETSTSTDEARDYLQLRLTLMFRVGFSLSLIFLVTIITVRGLVGSGIARELSDPSRWFHIIATLTLGLLWWVLARRGFSIAALRLMDSAGTLALVLLLNLNAGLFELRTVAVFNLVLTTGLTLLLRAAVIPSSARRTGLLGLAAALISIGVFWLSLVPAWPVAQTLEFSWPVEFQFISLMLWLSVLVATATVTSRVIYDLQRRVRRARKLGQYELGEKLGEGGMGVVYRATHRMLRREAALKLLRPERIDQAALQRFEREVVTTARLHHPNTVAVFDYGRTPEGLFYYTMEYLEGLTLDELVELNGPLPAGRVVWLLAQVCASLEEAHAAGLVHRDVKPSNIMVVGHPGAYDLVKLLDFGLAKALLAPGNGPRLSLADQIVGTPLFMAPESITRPDTVDAKSDLYAVAAVGYYLLTASPVFERASVVEICAAHLHEEPMPVHQRLGASVPEDLEELVMKGLAKSPADRAASAHAFREALLACQVSRWTEDDAMGWWQLHEHSRRRKSHAKVADRRTLSVSLLER